MRVNETPFLAARLDYGQLILGAPDLAQEVGRVLTRRCFAGLQRVRGRRPNRITRSVPVSADEIARQLLHAANDACTVDSAPRGWTRATAVVENGGGVTHGRRSMRRMAYLVLPVVRRQLDDVLRGIWDLARLLGAEAGFVAVDTSFERAEEVALGAMRRTRGRDWVSARRYRERQLREHRQDQITTELAGVEWGTFLGVGHLAAVSLDDVRRSGVFTRVELLTPALGYLQVTADPADDLTEQFEAELIAARLVLAPILMSDSLPSMTADVGAVTDHP
jgi:hypothetical protein